MRRTRRLSIMLLIFACTFIMGAAVAYADTNIVLTKDTTLDKIEDENVMITSKGDYKLVVANGINASGTVTIKGAKVFAEEYGIVAGGNINISDKAYVNSYSKDVVDHYGPRAISSKNGKVVVTDSEVEAEISRGGSYVINATNGFTATSSKLTLVTGENSSCGISTYNDGANIDIRNSAIKATIRGGDGLSAYRGDVYLENVSGIFNTGSEGISGYENVELKDCNITIDGGKDEPGAGLPPGGMFAYGTIKINGGKLVSKSELSDGIYANDEVSIGADTEYFEAQGKQYAVRVGSSGKITVAPGLTFADPAGGKVPEGYKVFTDKDGNAVSKVILKGRSTPPVVTKKANPIKVSGKTIKVKYKKLKKKSISFKRASAITVKDAKGTLSFKKTSGNKKIVVSKTGKVTVKKGLKKGKYTVKVKVTASGSKTYKAGSKTAIFKVKVIK